MPNTLQEAEWVFGRTFPSQSLKTCCIPGFGVREPVVIRRIYFEALSLQEFIAT